MQFRIPIKHGTDMSSFTDKTGIVGVYENGPLGMVLVIRDPTSETLAAVEAFLNPPPPAPAPSP